jgi:hypothetical protein
MGEGELENLRRQLSEIRDTKSSGRRYPKEVREAVVAYVCARRAQGLLLMEVLGDLGLSWGTARGWLREAGAAPAGEKAVASFRPVVVAAARSAMPMHTSALSLISPGGYRVEGMGVEQLLYLLRELG